MDKERQTRLVFSKRIQFAQEPTSSRVEATLASRKRTTCKLCKKNKIRQQCCNCRKYVWGRGGVEDTRIEAKDTKKSETKAKDSLSEDRHSRRPRTGMLEAKDTSASALQKKKGLHKNFSSDLHKKKLFFKFF